MPNRRPILPETVRFYRAKVVRTEDLSPNFRRVSVSSEELGDFVHLGFDHWFRFFVPNPGQLDWRLPTATSKLWYAQWLATPARQRPHCNNYTVADYRPDQRELDIDVVLHRRSSGELEGRVAQWAAVTQPGDAVALLDEGLLFNPPADTSAVVLAGEESALPALAGIVRSLAPDTTGLAVLEVPTRADVRDLPRPAGVDLHWVIRAETDPAATAGAAALTELTALTSATPPDPIRTYAFLVGESRLATEGRRHLVRLGLPKDRITFCGYWKSSTSDRRATRR
ncbi:MAG: siderophore-interacting protein [Microlunatus sp.]